MLTASQDIDSFIERQRNQLNKQNQRQGSNRSGPVQGPPPPIQQPLNNYQDRLDVRVARILDEPPPPPPPPQHRAQQPPDQSFYPAEPESYPTNAYSDQYSPYANQPPPPQDYRRAPNDNTDDNPVAFFNKFGTYDDKRSQLKDDLKREYNEYLQQQKRAPKSKSTSQLHSPRGPINNNNRRNQGQSNGGKVVAPWEKGDAKSNSNSHSLQDLATTRPEYPSNHLRAPVPEPFSRNQDERYIRDRESYVAELHAQIRELEARKKQLEFESSRLSGGPSSNVTRSHYKEDLNALNSLLAERLDQRNAVDLELAHILNRPPVSSSPTRIGSGAMMQLDMPPMNQSYSNQQGPRHPPNNARQGGPPVRNDRRQPPTDQGFVIGQDSDKEGEQAAKKRYQQELQAQIREAQMRKAQEKREKDEYDRKLDAEIQKYNYFGRSGGGAPMRDVDGNVVANLNDVRNPPRPTNGQEYSKPPIDHGYHNGSGPSAITNAPFYNGEQLQQAPYQPPTSDRSGSPTHARGALSNGLFGTAKTDEQVAREERYKLDLKKQIEEKRQRELEEVARKRAEEERELAKHLQWQQQMERQMAEEAARKQEKETQDRLQQQQMQEELERQRQQEEIAARRKPKRVEKPVTPKYETNNDNQTVGPSKTFDEAESGPAPTSETAFRSSSPPVPTLKNKGKKGKQKPAPPVQRQPSYDDAVQQSSPPPLPIGSEEGEFIEPGPPLPEETRSLQGQQTYRKPPTPRQPEITSARKKPPPAHQNRTRPNSNTGMVMRTNSNLSLRSDGSDSEVLNRLEHLKRQLKDKEARLQDHVSRYQSDTTSSNNIDTTKSSYQPSIVRKQSPGFMMNAPRVHHRDSPTNIDRSRRLIQADDDLEYKPGYFRDDTILMSGVTGAQPTRMDPLLERRRDSSERLFGSNIEREAASRRRYGYEGRDYYDNDDPTALANLELNRIAEQNEQRLKKLRDLESDDASLLDSNEVLERFQQKQRLQRGGSQTTLQDDAWFK